MKGTISSKLTSRSSNHAYGKSLKVTAAHEKDVVKLNVKALPHVRILSLSDTFVRQQSNSTKTIRVHKSIKHLATPILLSETLDKTYEHSLHGSFGVAANLAGNLLSLIIMSNYIS